MEESLEAYRKVIVSGNIIEVYEMEKAPYMGDKSPREDTYNALDIPLDFDNTMDKNLTHQEKRKQEIEEKKNRKEERREQTARDARNKVRRLALSNFTNHSKFLTLTFKENLQDIDEANKMFKYFIQKKLKPFMETQLEGFELKYITVLEFQKRGAIHYHMICNLPYVKWEKLLELWRCACKEGSLDIRDIKNVDNVGAYLIKYMTKNAGDPRLIKRKMYFTSKGLKAPVTYKGKAAELIIKQYEKNKIVFSNSYITEHLGQIDYKEYNLNRDY